MVIYSINDIEKLTGVKAHTIRIWEKRYDVIPHRRTDTNIRYYLDDDLQLILNIALLNRNGIKISKIAAMNHDEVRQKVAGLCHIDAAFEHHIDGLMLSIIELNEFKFLTILKSEIEIKGLEQTMEDTIYPLLDKLHAMWMVGSIKGVHESFVNNIILRMLHVEIDKLKHNLEDKARRVILFLPESESHDMSLVYAHFILKKYGAAILYLGKDVSAFDISSAVSTFKATYIFTILNDEPQDFSLQAYIDELAVLNVDTTILLMGYQLVNNTLNLPQNIKALNSISELKALIMNE